MFATDYVICEGVDALAVRGGATPSRCVEGLAGQEPGRSATPTTPGAAPSRCVDGLTAHHTQPRMEGGWGGTQRPH